MNNKGLWRIMEAVIAVLIVATGLLFFSSRQGVETGNDDIFKDMRVGLDEIAKNGVLRARILNSESVESDIEVIVKKRVDKNNLNYKAVICDFDINGCVCGSDDCPTTNKDIYSQERVISSSIDSDAKKIIKVLVWSN